MKPQSGKAKARRLQQRLRDKVLETFPELEPDDVVSVPMGTAGTDLLLSPKAKQRFPYSPECKNQERVNVWEAIKQAIANTKEGTEPMVVFTRNRHDTFVILRLDHFMTLLPKGAA